MPTTTPDGLPYETLDDGEPTRTLNGGRSGTADILAIKAQEALTDLRAAVQQLQDVVQPTTGWTIYEPTVTNAGSATFSTRTGRWRRIGFLTVHHIIFLVVSGDGSGSSTVQVDAPIPINRATRQTCIMSIEGASGGGGGNRLGYAISFIGGSPLERWDRLRFPDGADSHLDNMVGSDLVSGMIITIQGTYQEEESV